MNGTPVRPFHTCIAPTGKNLYFLDGGWRQLHWNDCQSFSHTGLDTISWLAFKNLESLMVWQKPPCWAISAWLTWEISVVFWFGPNCHSHRLNWWFLNCRRFGFEMMKVLNYTKRQEKGLWFVLKHVEWSLIIEKDSIIAIHLNWSNTQTVGNGDVMWWLKLKRWRISFTI